MPRQGSPVKRTALATRRAARLAVLRGSAFRPYDERKTILVAGTPRSGTTWLGQLFATIPRSAVMFEPLHGDEARKAGVGWSTVEGDTIDEAGAIDFVRRALQGRIRTRWTMRDNSVRSVLMARTWVMKEVRVNRVLPWMVRVFDLSRAVLLVRDPYAAVASQIAFAGDDPISGWLGAPRTRAPSALSRAFPWLADIEVEAQDAVAQLAFQWALDQLVPLSAPSPAWAILGYDAVRRDPRGQLAPLFAQWGLAFPDRLEERVAVPSSVTRAAPRYEFSLRERRTIEEVCRRVGLELISDDDRGMGVRLRNHLFPADEPR